VQSAPGRGTTFTLFFPAATHAAAVRDFRTSTWVRGTETILVVDDDEAVLGYVRESLEMNGYRVIATTSPMSAIDAFKQRHKEIALVVTDVVMPLMDGGELVRRLREIQPAVKVITISGYSRYHDDGGGIAPSAFLQKPFETSYLLNTVRRAIDAERAVP
jgi:DNA-binding NtrC family response regulator